MQAACCICAVTPCSLCHVSQDNVLVRALPGRQDGCTRFECHTLIPQHTHPHHTRHHKHSLTNTHTTTTQETGPRAIPCRSLPPAVPAAPAAPHLRVRAAPPVPPTAATTTLTPTATTTTTRTARRRAAAGKQERSSAWPDGTFRFRTGTLGGGVGVDCGSWCLLLLNAGLKWGKYTRSWTRAPHVPLFMIQ